MKQQETAKTKAQELACKDEEPTISAASQRRGDSQLQRIQSQGSVGQDDGLQSAFEQSRAIDHTSMYEAEEGQMSERREKRTSKMPLQPIGGGDEEVEDQQEISFNLAKELRVSLPSAQKGSGLRGGNQVNQNILSGGELLVSTGMYGSQDRRSTIRSMESNEDIDYHSSPQMNPLIENLQQSLRIRIMDELLKPLPLIPKGSAYQEGLDVPKWRQKKNILLSSGVKQQRQSISETIKQEETPLKDQGDDDIVPGDPDQKVKTVQQVMEKLNKYAEQIPLQNHIQINRDSYPKYFKYLIYECYKPENLSETRKLLQLFLLQSKASQLGGQAPQIDPHYYQLYLQYLRKDFTTKFPSYINERNLLSFDSNFECGNLDSAYVVNENEYNLLMKVDTNTKGSSFWFNFKVRGTWKSNVKQRNGHANTERSRVIKFNIVNFNKSDIKGFYQDGMNILSRVCRDEEETGGGGPSPVGIHRHRMWENSKCFDIEFFQNIELEKSSHGYNRYFYQLSFKYRFEPDKHSQGEDGPSVQFAYCMPYSFTDLLADLKHIKFQLLDGSLSTEATITYFNGRYGQGKSEDATDTDAKKEDTDLPADLGDDLMKPMMAQQPNFIERTRLNIYELQHMDIRNRGLRIIRLNQIEKALMQPGGDNSNSKNEEADQGLNIEGFMHDGNKSKNQTEAVVGDEFEIKSLSFSFRQEILGRTVGGLPIYMITISNNTGPYVINKFGQLTKKKKLIYITSRVHAGETHSSLIMMHLLYEICLTQKNSYELLLQNYIIKLVPMVNVDGVAIGNSRTSLVGLDLNRRWTEPNPLIHPEVFFLKKEMISSHKKTDGGIQIFCDLHGHNKAPNSFVYGCHKAANQGLLSWTKTRLLPKIIATRTPLFDFKQCQFKIDQCKLNTARVVCWNELKITNSFTLEISMYGKLVSKAHLKQIQKGQQDQNFSGNPQGEGAAPLSPKGASAALGDGDSKTIVSFDAVDFEQIAISLLQSLVQYNALEPQLEQEFQQTGGWLKVSKLNHMTGKAARDRMIEEQAIANKLKQQNDLIAAQGKRVGNKKSQQTKERSGNAKKQIHHVQSFKGGANKANSEEETKDDAGQGPVDQVGNKISSNNVSEKDSSNQLNRRLSDKMSSAISATIRHQHLKSKSKSQGLQEPVLAKHQNRGSTSPGMFNWRDFFEQDELEGLIKGKKMVRQGKSISKNEIPEDENEDAASEDKSDKGGSDSDPSEDNIDPQEFLDMVQDVFKEDEDVTFKELKPQLPKLRTPRGVEEQASLPVVVKPSSPMPERLLTEEEGYNFILKPVLQGNTISPPQISNFPPPPPMVVMVGNTSNTKNAPLEIQSENYKKLIEGQRAKVVGTFDPEHGVFPIGKSPVTLKNNNTSYTAWSQSKNRNFGSQEKGGRPIPKLTKIRASNQQQSLKIQNTIQNEGGISQKQQLLSEIVQGGMSRLQEIEKNIFSTQQSNQTKPGTQQHTNPYLQKIAGSGGGGHEAKLQSAPGSNQMHSNLKNNYFSGEDHTSFESYMQIVKPSNANVSFTHSDNRQQQQNRKVFSGGAALRDEIQQAQTLPIAMVMQGGNVNHRVNAANVYQHLSSNQVALLRQSVNSVNQNNDEENLKVNSSPPVRTRQPAYHQNHYAANTENKPNNQSNVVVMPARSHRSSQNNEMISDSQRQHLYKTDKKQSKTKKVIQMVSEHDQYQMESHNYNDVQVDYLNNSQVQSPDKQGKPSSSVSPAVLMTKRLEQWKQQTAQMSFLRDNPQHFNALKQAHLKNSMIGVIQHQVNQKQRILLNHQQQQQLNNSRGDHQVFPVIQNSQYQSLEPHRTGSSQLRNKRQKEHYHNMGGLAGNPQLVRESYSLQPQGQGLNNPHQVDGYTVSFMNAAAPISLTQVHQSQQNHPLISNSTLSKNDLQNQPAGIHREKNLSQPQINGGPHAAASLTDLKVQQNIHQLIQPPQSSRLLKDPPSSKKKQTNIRQSSGTIVVQVGSQQLTDFQEKMRQQFQKQYINSGQGQLKDSSTKQSISYTSQLEKRDKSPTPGLGQARLSQIVGASPAIASPRQSLKFSDQHAHFMQNLASSAKVPEGRQGNQTPPRKQPSRGATPNLSVVMNGSTHNFGGLNRDHLK